MCSCYNKKDFFFVTAPCLTEINPSNSFKSVFGNCHSLSVFSSWHLLQCDFLFLSIFSFYHPNPQYLDPPTLPLLSFFLNRINSFFLSLLLICFSLFLYVCISDFSYSLYVTIALLYLFFQSRFVSHPDNFLSTSHISFALSFDILLSVFLLY